MEGKTKRWTEEYFDLSKLITGKKAIEEGLIVEKAVVPLAKFFFFISHEKEIQRWLVCSDGTLVEGRMLIVLGFLAQEDRFCFSKIRQLADYLYKYHEFQCFNSSESVRVFLYHPAPADILPLLREIIKKV